MKNGLPPVCSRIASARSARRPVDAGGELDVVGDPVRVEAAQRDPARALDPGELAERVGERVVAAELDVAVGADQQQAGAGEPAGDEAQQQQRGLVGPVQVVEHDHQRARARGAGEEAGERVEEPEARLLGLHVRRLADVAEALGELGDDLGDVGGAAAELPAQADRVGVADVGAQRLRPGPVRAAGPRPRGSGPSRRARRGRGRRWRAARRSGSCRSPARRRAAAAGPGRASASSSSVAHLARARRRGRRRRRRRGLERVLGAPRRRAPRPARRRRPRSRAAPRRRSAGGRRATWRAAAGPARRAPAGSPGGGARARPAAAFRCWPMIATASSPGNGGSPVSSS